MIHMDGTTLQHFLTSIEVEWQVPSDNLNMQ